MNTSSANDGENRGKHFLPYPLISLIDKHGNCAWVSDDPLGEIAKIGTSVVEAVIELDRERILDAMSRCFFKRETVDYTVRGQPAVSMPDLVPADVVHWRVRIMPIPHSDLAACCLCRVLPEYHAEITDDERQILRLLCEDRTLKEIAQAMFLSDSAIDSKMRHLKDKVGVKTIAGLVAQALSKFIV